MWLAVYRLIRPWMTILWEWQCDNSAVSRNTEIALAIFNKQLTLYTYIIVKWVSSRFSGATSRLVISVSDTQQIDMYMKSYWLRWIIRNGECAEQSNCTLRYSIYNKLCELTVKLLPDLKYSFRNQYLDYIAHILHTPWFPLLFFVFDSPLSHSPSPSLALALALALILVPISKTIVCKRCKALFLSPPLAPPLALRYRLFRIWRVLFSLLSRLETFHFILH